MQKMFKAVIFDLDNTLIDFMKFKTACCDSAVDAMIDAGLKFPKKKALDMVYDIYETKGYEHHLAFQDFLKKVEGKVDPKKLAYAIIAYRRTKGGVFNTYPGTKRTLVKLKEKGLKLAVVSDANRLKVWIRLSLMRLDDFFDVVVTLEDTGRMKPSKLPFKAALKKLKIKPEECLMVGDMPNRDIKGAKALGMKTCLANYGYMDGLKAKKSKLKVKPDFFIDKIEDLVGVVLND